MLGFAGFSSAECEICSETMEEGKVRGLLGGISGVWMIPEKNERWEVMETIVPRKPGRR